MILSYVICFIAMLIAHYIGDYFLQSREVAVNKSTSTKHMFSHFTDLYCSFTLAFIILVSIGFLFNSPCFLKAADIMFYIDVITSYSIHYTKLYETRRRRSLRRWWRRSRRARPSPRPCARPRAASRRRRW